MGGEDMRLGRPEKALLLRVPARPEAQVAGPRASLGSSLPQLWPGRGWGSGRWTRLSPGPGSKSRRSEALGAGCPQGWKRRHVCQRDTDGPVTSGMCTGRGRRCRCVSGVCDAVGVQAGTASAQGAPCKSLLLWFQGPVGRTGP